MASAWCMKRWLSGCVAPPAIHDGALGKFLHQFMERQQTTKHAGNNNANDAHIIQIEESGRSVTR